MLLCKFVCRVAASRSDSTTHDAPSGADEPAKELQLDEFIELNLQELNPDRESLGYAGLPPSAVPSALDIVTIDPPPGGSTEPIRVRWSSHAPETFVLNSHNREIAVIADLAPAARPTSFGSGFAMIGGAPRLADASANDSPARPSASKTAVGDGSRTNLVLRSIADSNNHNNKTSDARSDTSNSSCTALGLRRAGDAEFCNGSTWAPVSKLSIVVTDESETQGGMMACDGPAWISGGEGLEYEAPDPNQCTVSSLTPLLRALGEDEGEGGSGKDGC